MNSPVRLGVPEPPQVFSIRGLRLYFPKLELWIAQCISLPSCPSRFICTRMWAATLTTSNSLACPRPPATALLQVLSTRLPISTPPTGLDECFLTPWLSDFDTVQFSVSSDCFLCLNLFLSFFWLCKEVQCVYLCLPMPSWLKVPKRE